MSHKTRVERHVIVDILAAIAGGSVLLMLTSPSWLGGILLIASALTVYLLDRNNIEEEDKLETNSDYFPEPVVRTEFVLKPSLNAKDVGVLRKKASHPPTEDVPVDGLALYIAGLEDGTAEMAKWVLNQIEDSE